MTEADTKVCGFVILLTSEGGLDTVWIQCQLPLGHEGRHRHTDDGPLKPELTWEQDR